MRDDLSPLFAPAPASAGQPMTHRQGLVIAWDPVTLANTIRVGDTDLVDLPVLGVAEAASIAPGAVVGLAVVGSTLAIIGRWVIPGTADATAAITGLSTRTVSATVATFETTGSGTFTDLTTVGPTVTATIGASGRAIVLISASLALTSQSAVMGFEVSGASTLAAADTRALKFGDSSAGGTALAFTRVVEVSGLNAGANVFRAKYRVLLGTPGFSERNLTVMAL